MVSSHLETMKVEELQVELDKARTEAAAKNRALQSQLLERSRQLEASERLFNQMHQQALVIVNEDDGGKDSERASLLVKLEKLQVDLDKARTEAATEIQSLQSQVLEQSRQLETSERLFNQMHRQAHNAADAAEKDGERESLLVKLEQLQVELDKARTDAATEIQSLQSRLFEQNRQLEISERLFNQMHRQAHRAADRVPQDREATRMKLEQLQEDLNRARTEGETENQALQSQVLEQSRQLETRERLFNQMHAQAEIISAEGRAVKERECTSLLEEVKQLRVDLEKSRVVSAAKNEALHSQLLERSRQLETNERIFNQMHLVSVMKTEPINATEEDSDDASTRESPSLVARIRSLESSLAAAQTEVNVYRDEADDMFDMVEDLRQQLREEYEWIDKLTDANEHLLDDAVTSKQILDVYKATMPGEVFEDIECFLEIDTPEAHFERSKQLVAVSAELRAKMGEVEDLAMTMDALEDIHERDQEELSRLRSALEQQTLASQTLEECVAEQKKVLDDTSHSLDHVKEAEGSANLQLQKYSLELEAYSLEREAKDNELHSLKEQIKRLQDEFAEKEHLQRSAAVQWKQDAALETTVEIEKAALTSMLEALGENLTELDTTNEEIKAENSRLQALHATTLETEREAFESRVLQLEVANKGLQREITEISQQETEAEKLRAADLRAADLRAADLRAADLRAADLHAADLRAADLHAADLQRVEMQELMDQIATLKTYEQETQSWEVAHSEATRKLEQAGRELESLDEQHRSALDEIQQLNDRIQTVELERATVEQSVLVASEAAKTSALEWQQYNTQQAQQFEQEKAALVAEMQKTIQEPEMEKLQQQISTKEEECASLRTAYAEASEKLEKQDLELKNLLGVHQTLTHEVVTLKSEGLDLASLQATCDESTKELEQKECDIEDLNEKYRSMVDEVAMLKDKEKELLSLQATHLESAKQLEQKECELAALNERCHSMVNEVAMLNTKEQEFQSLQLTYCETTTQLEQRERDLETLEAKHRAAADEMQHLQDHCRTVEQNLATAEQNALMVGEAAKTSALEWQQYNAQQTQLFEQEKAALAAEMQDLISKQPETDNLQQQVTMFQSNEHSLQAALEEAAEKLAQKEREFEHLDGMHQSAVDTVAVLQSREQELQATLATKLEQKELELRGLDEQLRARDDEVAALKTNEQNLESLQATYADAATKLEHRENELESLVGKHRSAADEILQWQDRVRSLESSLASAEQNALMASEAATTAALEWKQYCARQTEQLEQEQENLMAKESELKNVYQEVASHKTKEEEFKLLQSTYLEAISTLEQKVDTLERVDEKHRAAVDEIQQLHERVRIVDESRATAEKNAFEATEAAKTAALEWQQYCANQAQLFEQEKALLTAEVATAKAKEQDLESLQAAYADATNKLEQRTVELERLDGKHRSATQEVAALKVVEQEFKSLQIAFSEATSKLEEKQHELATLSEKHQLAADEVAALQAKEKELKSLHAVYSETKETAERSERALDSLQGKYRSAIDEAQTLEARVSEQNKLLDETTNSLNHASEVAEVSAIRWQDYANQQLQMYTLEREAKDNEVESLKDQIRRTRDEYTETELALKQAESATVQWQQYIATLEGSFKTEKSAWTSEAEALQEELTKLKAKNMEITAEKSRLQVRQAAASETEREEFENRIRQLELANKDLQRKTSEKEHQREMELLDKQREADLQCRKVQQEADDKIQQLQDRVRTLDRDLGTAEKNALMASEVAETSAFEWQQYNARQAQLFDQDKASLVVEVQNFMAKQSEMEQQVASLQTKELEWRELQTSHSEATKKLERRERELEVLDEKHRSMVAEVASLKTKEYELKALENAYSEAVRKLEQKEHELQSLDGKHRSTVDQVATLQTKEQEFRSLQAAYSEATRKLERQELELESLDGKHRSRIDEVASLKMTEQELRTLQATHSEATKKMEKMERELENLGGIYRSTTDEVAALKAKEVELTMLHAAHSEAMRKLEVRERDLENLDGRHRSTVDEVAVLKTKEQELQSLQSVYADSKERMERSERALANLEEKYRVAVDEVRQVEENKTVWRNQLDAEVAAIRASTREELDRVQLENLKKSLEQQAQYEKAVREAQEKMNKLSNELASKSADLDRAQTLQKIPPPPPLTESEHTRSLETALQSVMSKVEIQEREMKQMRIARDAEIREAAQREKAAQLQKTELMETKVQEMVYSLDAKQRDLQKRDQALAESQRREARLREMLQQQLGREHSQRLPPLKHLPAVKREDSNVSSTELDSVPKISSPSSIPPPPPPPSPPRNHEERSPADTPTKDPTTPNTNPWWSSVAKHFVTTTDVQQLLEFPEG